MNKLANVASDCTNPSPQRMTLDEARKVLWLQNNHRPLGELLDKGYLTQRRLEWAAEKAHDPTLRQASKVLLDAQQQGRSSPTHSSDATTPDTPLGAALPVRITLEQARATEWPFKPYKGESMGPLVETRQLSLRDLAYAIENAWEERIRQAAIVLMLV
ncbi:MAG TPA: hypothetical protein VMT34_13410, partial [Aggregatilineales bacterium]|nr:hypothetical protein [Aggregatilineales bacterium]